MLKTERKILIKTLSLKRLQNYRQNDNVLHFQALVCTKFKAVF